jgi:hypothetical protein
MTCRCARKKSLTISETTISAENADIPQLTTILAFEVRGCDVDHGIIFTALSDLPTLRNLKIHTRFFSELILKLP